jgi:hypothetical protein
MPAITLPDLRLLLDQFTGEGLVLSCYADLGVTTGFRPDWQGRLKSLADGIEKDLGQDGRGVQELGENLAAVRAALEGPDLHVVSWAAVFSATRRGFLRVVPLDVPVETDLVFDRSPYLVPLLAAALRRREYLVIHTDTHRGRVYAATPGEVRLLAGLDEDVPQKQHSAGETWGYAQATIVHHRQDRILHYRKALVREAERLWAAGRYAGLVLLGEHDVLEHVREDLPPQLAGRVVRETAAPWYERPSEVEEEIRTQVAALSAADEAGVAPDFWDRLREGKAVATGPQAVLDAVQGGRVGPDGYGYLVFGPDPRETVGRCSVCRWLTLDGPGPCPRCQAPCVPGNLWEELLLTALQHRIVAHFVKDPRMLAPYNGVAAALPKSEAG